MNFTPGHGGCYSTRRFLRMGDLGLGVEVTYGVVSVCGGNKWVGRSCWEKHCHHLMLLLWLWLCLPIYVTPSTQSPPHIIKGILPLSLSPCMSKQRRFGYSKPLILVASFLLCSSSVISCILILRELLICAFLWITLNGVGWIEVPKLAFSCFRWSDRLHSKVLYSYITLGARLQW